MAMAPTLKDVEGDSLDFYVAKFDDGTTKPITSITKGKLEYLLAGKNAGALSGENSVFYETIHGESKNKLEV